MKQHISGGEYARAMAKRIAIFTVITFAFPYIVAGIVEISGARRVSGAGGAVAVVIGIFLKPLIYFIFTMSTIRISHRRAKTIGISATCGLCVPLLILCDLPFGITFGSFWGVGFSLGIMSRMLPFFLLTAVITAATLSLLKPVEASSDVPTSIEFTIWKSLLYLSSILAVIVLLPTLTSWTLGMGAMQFNLALMKVMFYLKNFLAYPYSLLAAFAAASVVLVLRSRRFTNGTGTDAGRPSREPEILFGNRSVPGRSP